MTLGHDISEDDMLLCVGDDDSVDADHCEVGSSSSGMASGLPASSVGSNGDESKTARCSYRRGTISIGIHREERRVATDFRTASRRADNPFGDSARLLLSFQEC